MKKILVLFFVLLLVNQSFSQIVIEGDITNDLTFTADNTYLLKGFVRVKSGASLIIEAGTMIFGENSSQGSLIVQPGGKIFANGTAENPIVFTSEFARAGASRPPTYGDWGGIIILGNAKINPTGGTAQIEGPGDTYGGTNDDDNSGVLRYVRIEYPGIAFSPNNEINGLTFGGVGRGTTVEYIQVSYSGDDSYEFFGGTVNCKYLIAYRGWDDDFDTDFGYSGKLQYLVSLRDPEIADQSSSNGFESDNDGSGSSNEPLTSPTWWNVSIFGPKYSSDNPINSLYRRGMHLRRNSQNKINNALIMGWPTGVLLDSKGTINGAVNGTMYIKNSIIAGCTNNIDTASSTGTFNPTEWFTTTMNGRTFVSNSEVMIQNPFVLTQPNFLPRQGSPVLTGAGTPPNDGFFDPTANFVGAFGTKDWTQGWANWNPKGYGDNVIEIEGDITSDLTLTSNNNYLLKGFVRVKSGASLTIEAGTMIFGENSSQGSLIVQPGGKIFANGTAENPIVFTSEFTRAGASRPPTYGDWGGIIILGNAKINPTGGTAQIEGPGDTYGGTNDDDNSGVLRYVRIEYPGIAFSPNNEINGLTFGGVGRGTTVEYIQVSYSGDDSYEFFGGTVNCKYLIAYRGWDDDFDTDFGYSGKLQYLVSLRDPEIADQSSSNGFESDNDGSGSSNEPLTSPTWWNVSIFGPKYSSDNPINSLYRRGMHLRRNSQNKINNALIMGWPTGVLLDSKGTINGAVNGTMYIKNSIIAGCTNNIDTASSTGTFNPTEWFTTTMNGRTFVSNSEVMLYRSFDLLNPDFLPMSGSPVLTGAGTPPNDGFFDPTANFVGAFNDTDWTAGWANWNPSNITSIREDKIPTGINPTSFELNQNFPNPFNPTTTIRFSLPEAGFVKLIVYNILGEEVKTLVDGFRNVGTYNVQWNASNLASGIYIYRLQTEKFVEMKKMILMK
ncbi:MAG: hypothetical protein STSR0008_15980 [Ignavibacterium sp.]